MGSLAPLLLLMEMPVSVRKKNHHHDDHPSSIHQSINHHHHSEKKEEVKNNNNKERKKVGWVIDASMSTSLLAVGDNVCIFNGKDVSFFLLPYADCNSFYKAIKLFLENSHNKSVILCYSPTQLSHLATLARKHDQEFL